MSKRTKISQGEADLLQTMRGEVVMAEAEAGRAQSTFRYTVMKTLVSHGMPDGNVCLVCNTIGSKACTCDG